MVGKATSSDKLLNHVDVLYGFPFNSKLFNNNGEGLPLLRIRDINTGLSDTFTTEQADEKYLLNDGDILFARSGNTVGKTFRYKAEHGRGIYAGFLIRLIPDTTKVLPDYVFGFTKSAFYEDFVKKTQRAVGQPNINAQEYGDLQICLPPLEEQKRFSEFMAQSDKSKFVV